MFYSFKCLFLWISKFVLKRIHFLLYHFRKNKSNKLRKPLYKFRSIGQVPPGLATLQSAHTSLHSPAKLCQYAISQTHTHTTHRKPETDPPPSHQSLSGVYFVPNALILIQLSGRSTTSTQHTTTTVLSRGSGNRLPSTIEVRIPSSRCSAHEHTHTLKHFSQAQCTLRVAWSVVFRL